tara:strand:- start:1161 stop:2366 length:1206 start_codon:yes stop_codon:yes gene_type:complete
MSRTTDLIDLYLKPTEWGRSSWLLPTDEDRLWLDNLVTKTHLYTQGGGKFDYSLQVTIPNEWEKIAPINIGYTAGIETNIVSPEWIKRSTLMDKIIVVSNHSKDVYVDTVYQGVIQSTNTPIELKCQTPIEVVNYPAREYEPANIKLDLDYDFNYLAIAQWGPRKNLENTVKWWVEEFKDEEVGLVVKTNLVKTSIIDRMVTLGRIENHLATYKDRKCKVYLLHGNMTPEEMTSLYRHPKVKCLVSLTHGEGFGLPLWEAAYNGLPVMAPDWSGQRDFLYAKKKVRRWKGQKKKVTKMVPHFCVVDHEMGQVPPSMVWDGVIQANAGWCYPDEGSYKFNLRKMLNNYGHFKKQAAVLMRYVKKEFENERQYNRFIEAMNLPDVEDADTWAENIEALIKNYE